MALSNWLTQRMKEYQSLMNRIHTMIGKVVKTDKEERGRRIKIQAAVKGHDPKAFAHTNLMIKDGATLAEIIRRSSCHHL